MAKDELDLREELMTLGLSEGGPDLKKEITEIAKSDVGDDLREIIDSQELAKGVLGEDMRDSIEILGEEHFSWLGLRQADRTKACTCVKDTGTPRKACSHCLGTGFGYTDYLVKGYTWLSTDGAEFVSAAGRISTQTRNAVVKHTRALRKFDQILVLALDPDTGETTQPFQITRTFLVQDTLALKASGGRTEFWRCSLVERSFSNDKPGEPGTTYKHTSNR